MRTSDAKWMAEAALKEHGLDREGWTFAWMAERTRQRLGQCHYGKKAIQLSLRYVRKNGLFTVLDIVLHEVAHALVGPRTGHGAEWKAKCVEIGAVPERLIRNVKVRQPPPRYQQQASWDPSISPMASRAASS